MSLSSPLIQSFCLASILCLVGCNFDDSLSNLDEVDMSASPMDMKPPVKDEGTFDKGSKDLVVVEDMGRDDAGAVDMADMVQLAPCKSNPVFQSGSGVPDDPFVICNAEQFLAMAMMSGRFYALDRDIDMTGIAWTPIEVFTGQLDGRGHRINGLSVTGEGNMGGFCNVLTGTLRDVEFFDILVSSSGSGVGGIAHVSQGATVERVKIYGGIEAQSYAGMFAARINNGPQSPGIYSDIIIDGSIEVYGEGTSLDGSTTGTDGQVGLLAGEVGPGVSITRTHVFGTIFAERSPVSAWKLGGVIGRMREASLSESTSEVSIIADRSTRVGGVAGELISSSLMHILSITSVSGEGFVGGVAGEVRGQSTIDFVISDSLVSATSAMSPAGGIVGGVDAGARVTGSFAYYSLVSVPQDALSYSDGLTSAEITQADRYEAWPSPPWIIQDKELPLLDSYDFIDIGF